MSLPEHAKSAHSKLHAPMVELLGIEVLRSKEGRVALSVQPREEFSNQLSMMHGGFVATVLDCACGAAVYSLLKSGEHCVSADLRTSFLAPVPIGEMLLKANGLVRKMGWRVAFAEAELLGPEGKLYATASATMIIKRNRPAAG